MIKTLQIIILVCLVQFSQAQLATGTTNIHPSAQLQVEASNKGILVPRVTLTGTGDATTVSSPARGLLVYNTNTASSGATAVTPGFYYYEGGKWQRVISQQPDATVEFTSPTNDPNNVSTTFTGTSGSKDYVYISSTNGSQWTYNGTLYVTYTPPASTPFYLTGGTNDAGSNKTGDIYRTSGNLGLGTSTPATRLDARATTGDGAIGIGQSTQSFSAAGAGAVRYSTASGGTLQYSNGAAWNTLTATTQKVTIVAKKTTSQSVPAGTETYVTGWSEIADVSNDFDPSTGIFTAPRAGNYIIAFSYTFISQSVNASSVAEAQLVPSTDNFVSINSANIKKSVTSFPASGTAEPGAAISFVLNLSSGEKVRPRIYQSTGVTGVFRVGTGNNDGFVNLSVAEL